MKSAGIKLAWASNQKAHRKTMQVVIISVYYNASCYITSKIGIKAPITVTFNTTSTL